MTLQPLIEIPNTTSTEVPLKRERRIAPLIGGLIAVLCSSLFSAGIGAGMGIASQKKVDEKKFYQLERQLTRLMRMNEEQDRESVGLRDDLIGYTNYTHRRTRETSNVFARLQTEYMEEINKQALLINRLSQGDLVSTQILFAMISEADYMRRTSEILNELKQKVQAYELAISQMQEGYLPSNLVSYKKLRSILDSVVKVLPAEYSPYFGKESIARYYSIPLVNFIVRAGHIFIRLAIPLISTTDPRHAPEVDLYRPSFLSFPKPINWRSTGDFEFVRLKDMKNQIWTFHGNQFHALSNKKYFNCLQRADQAICLSFYEKPYEQPDICISTVIGGEHRDRIAKNCQFTYAPIEDYMPVELDTGRYYIHRTENITYFEDCLGNQKRLRLNHSYDGFSVTIPPGCSLRFKNKIRRRTSEGDRRSC